MWLVYSIIIFKWADHWRDEHCNFGDTLNRRIRDQLVLGISDDKIQRRLLSEAGSLTLDKALDIAKGLEAAARGVEELSRAKTSEAAETVQKTIINCQRNDPTRGGRLCYRCGSNRHLAKSCRYNLDAGKSSMTSMMINDDIVMTSIRGC